MFLIFLFLLFTCVNAGGTKSDCVDGNSASLCSQKLSLDSAPASVAGKDVGHPSSGKTVEAASLLPKEASSLLDK